MKKPVLVMGAGFLWYNVYVFPYHDKEELVRIIKYRYFFIYMLLLLLMGCTNNSTSENDNNTELNNISNEIKLINERLSKYELELAKKDQKIKELRSLIESNMMSNNQIFIELSNNINRNEHLIKHLPDISLKQGYIKELVKDAQGTFFIIDYAEWQSKSDAPNGGLLVNEKEETDKIKINNEIISFVLDGASLTLQPFKDFNPKDHEHSGLFDLYIINNEIILISERYLP
jgi:hypothetical protein